MATTKARQELRAKFVRNAIPTEQDFKDLIDAPLNQSDDGIFRNSGEPLSIVAGSDGQKRVLRFYGDPPANATAPDWLISLNPGQDPNDATTNRRGFGIADGAGATRLYLDAAGNLGLGTNAPQAKLHVAGGGARIEGDLTVTGTTVFSGSVTASGPVTLGRDDGSTNVVVRGAVQAAHSDIYFTKTDHIHSGIGNVSGHAAIENAQNFEALMILGRQTTGGRIVKLWDRLEINGTFRATGSADFDGSLTIGSRTPFRIGGGLGPQPSGSGTFNVGDWSVRANGNVLQIVHISASRLTGGSSGGLVGIGFGTTETIVAQFNASQAGSNRLTFP